MSKLSIFSFYISLDQLSEHPSNDFISDNPCSVSYTPLSSSVSETFPISSNHSPPPWSKTSGLEAHLVESPPSNLLSGNNISSFRDTTICGNSASVNVHDDEANALSVHLSPDSDEQHPKASLVLQSEIRSPQSLVLKETSRLNFSPAPSHPCGSGVLELLLSSDLPDSLEPCPMGLSPGTSPVRHNELGITSRSLVDPGPRFCNNRQRQHHLKQQKQS
ncbi:unnamed protein product, partial [Protopolystoma xenopodis]